MNSERLNTIISDVSNNNLSIESLNTAIDEVLQEILALGRDNPRTNSFVFDISNNLPDLSYNVFSFSSPTTRDISGLFSSSNRENIPVFSSRNNRRTFNSNYTFSNLFQPQPYNNRFLSRNGTFNIDNILEETLFDDTHLYKNVISEKGKQSIQYKLYDISNNTTETCPITLLPFTLNQEVAILPCSHKFSKDAILQWLEKEQSKCPICRYKFDSVEEKKDMSNNFIRPTLPPSLSRSFEISNRNPLRDIFSTLPPPRRRRRIRRSPITRNLFSTSRYVVPDMSNNILNQNENDVFLQQAIMNSLQNDTSNNTIENDTSNNTIENEVLTDISDDIYSDNEETNMGTDRYLYTSIPIVSSTDYSSDEFETFEDNNSLDSFDLVFSQNNDVTSELESDIDSNNNDTESQSDYETDEEELENSNILNNSDIEIEFEQFI